MIIRGPDGLRRTTVVVDGQLCVKIADPPALLDDEVEVDLSGLVDYEFRILEMPRGTSPGVPDEAGLAAIERTAFAALVRRG